MHIANKIIFLTGFMGAGKSTVGSLLAKQMNCKFVDLDSVIVEQEGRSIASIFSENGEDCFRDLESNVLKNLDLASPSVVATGGGIVLRDTNRTVMRENGTVVYLKASWPVTKSRLLDSTERPLVNQENGWDSVKMRWIERQKYYEDADYIIDTDILTPQQCVEEILKDVIDH